MGTVLWGRLPTHSCAHTTLALSRGSLTGVISSLGVGTPRMVRQSQVDPGPDTLLADLLRLPDSTDPVRWLQDHRLSLAARLVLEHLLQRVVPMEDLVVSAINGSPLRSIRPRVHTRSNGSLHVKVRQIDILELGFALHLRVRFSLPRGWSSAKQQGIIRQWEGFRSIRDCRPSAIMGHVRGVENPRV